jgi:transcriptional regulator with XRE-family HTH domain
LENGQLRAAIRSAGLTLEEFADIAAVDVKTVQRWLAGRNPHPANRARVAAALDTPEHELWPDAVPSSDGSPEDGRLVPALTDVLAGYGHASDRGAPDPVDILRSAAERIELIELIVANLTPSIVDLLLDNASDGCHVRAIIEDPDAPLEPLLAVDGIEIRASDGGEEFRFYRADDQMLLVLHRIGVLTESPPVIVIQRRTGAGLFDRLAHAFEQRWDDTTPLPNRERLHAYLADVEREPWPEPDSDPDRVAPPTAIDPARGAFDPDRPRRWPGRRPAD